MNICKCHIEPLIMSDFKVHERLKGHDYDEMRVLVFAEGFEQEYWFINLPEQIYLNNQEYRFQIGMNWESDNGRWFYRDCPIRNLLGCWDQTGPKVRLRTLSHNERPIVGYQASTISSDERGIHYQVSVTNNSGEIWRDVYTWICFNSFQSPATGYRPYVRTGDRWIPFQDIPNVTMHCYLPTNRMRDEYSRSLIKNVDTSVSFPGVVAWNITDDGALLTCHYSSDALAVGSNQQWPCTDIFLWFGDIQSGQTGIRRGHVLIARTNISLFSEKADELLKETIVR